MGLPVEVNNLMLGSLGGYTVGRSLRFRSSATAYLNRTPSVTGSRQKFTWSAWVKRGLLTTGTYYQLFGAGPGAGGNEGIFFDTTAGGLYLTNDGPSTAIITSAVFRDPSAWYHIVCAVDTTQATAANRQIFYINGVQQTSYTGSYCAQNTNFTSINVSGVQHRIGAHLSSGYYFDGYMAEVNFIDGQQLTPSSFGAYDTNGVWQPKKYSGTYGTNGFYLPFTSGFNTTQTYAGGFNGSNQYLSLGANAAYSMGTGDFTFEANVNFNALPSASGITAIFGNETNTVSAANDKFWIGLYNSAGQYQLRFGRHNAPNGSWTVWTPTVGTWYHVAIVRQSGVISIYINGVSQTMVQASDMSHSFGQNGLTLGLVSTPYYMNGYISNARYVVGSAVYTTGFTPPSANLTAITNTKLLTLQNATIIDNSSLAATITNTGSIVTTNQYPFQYTLASVSSDYSGNNNNWTTNNINATFLGTTYDNMIDSPTNAAGTSTGIGNYATFNPLVKFAPNNSVYSSGNLGIQQTGGASGSHACAMATIAMSSGKWYAEFSDDTATYDGNRFGILNINNLANYTNANPYIGWASDGYVIYKTSTNAVKENNGSSTNIGSNWTAGAIISVAVDIDNSKIWWRVNGGAWFGGGDPAAGTSPVFTIASGNTYAFAVSPYNNNGVTANFGQRPFTYTPPSGFKALNTYNLPAPIIANGAQYMAATTYTGNGTAGRVITVPNINEVGFAWVKSRSGIDDHRLANIVTGGNKHLKSNTTDAESTGTNIIQAFSSNTFTVGNDTSVNANGSTYVGWTWAANGTGVTNNSGTITSTVSASPSSGFSIATYTGTGANATVGHGLGVAPSMVIVKGRSYVSNWNVWHTSLTSAAYDLQLNTTTNQFSSPTMWNSTAPTSSVFSIGTSPDINVNGSTYVAYCFSAVSGYSAFGKYTGNGSADGPFIYTGFRPRFILLKNSSNGAHWTIIDTSRDTTNVAKTNLFPNLSSAENTTGGDYDILSNGFKLRSVVLNETNGSGMTYIYAAFAEHPFNISRAR